MAGVCGTGAAHLVVARKQEEHLGFCPLSGHPLSDPTPSHHALPLEGSAPLGSTTLRARPLTRGLWETVKIETMAWIMSVTESTCVGAGAPDAHRPWLASVCRGPLTVQRVLLVGPAVANAK